MLPDYVYFVVAVVLSLTTALVLPFRRSRQRLLAALPGLAFFALLLLCAEAAFHVGRAQGGGSGAAGGTLYTCSMHLQVQQPEPGLCPICNMELVPLAAAAGGDDSNEVRIDPVVVQHMGVRIAAAAKAPLVRTVRAFGELRIAEDRLADVALKVDGFVEQLFATTLGMPIEQGAPLFAIYAPELVVAQAELIAAHRSGDPDLLAAARQKLSLWDVPASEIDRLQQLQAPERTLVFRAPRGGVLLEKSVVPGAPAEKNRVLLRIADLSVLWLDAQVQDGLLDQLAPGQAAVAELAARPGTEIQGRVVFVAPEVDRQLRTATVRLEVAGLGLRPGMFARVAIELPAGPDVLQVPKEAVLDTGRRRLLWLCVGKGRFEPRDVTTGRHGDDGNVEILDGIAAGDAVVLSGQFLIDAESRVRESARKFSATGLLPDGDLPPPPPIALSATTQRAVDALLQTYLHVARELVQDRTPVDGWQALQQAANATSSASEPEVLPLAEALALTLAEAKTELEPMRIAFKQVSTAAIALFARARPQPGGKAEGTLFVHHCPMAEADWLQLDAATKNPYYGSSMLACGEVRREVPLGAATAGGK